MAEEYKQGLINRLKSIEGHVRGIQRMVDEDVYCIDIINQNLAVQRALEKVNSLILERHLQTCVTTAIKGDDPDDRERVIAEIMTVFEATAKMEGHVRCQGSTVSGPAINPVLPEEERRGGNRDPRGSDGSGRDEIPLPDRRPVR